MTDTSAHEAVAEQVFIESLGLGTGDVCMLPDCGCDGNRHEM